MSRLPALSTAITNGIITGSLTALLTLTSAQALSEPTPPETTITDKTATSPLTFAIVGDMPYTDAEEIALSGPIYEAIQLSKVPLLLHLGDLKSGGESCSPTFFRIRYTLLMNLLPGRTIYTPGDNEWTDCDRHTLSDPMSELDMLADIRSVITEQDPAYPADWNLASQPGYPENHIWKTGDVQFVNLHIVGTNNGRYQIVKSDVEETLDAVKQRDIADLEWLTLAFQQANKNNAKALVISHHADITDVKYKDVRCTDDSPEKCDAFLEYRQLLAGLAKEFKSDNGDLKPVLVVHGDTHEYCMAKDMGSDNIWRLNAWGDFKVPADATWVEVDTGNKEKPFSVQTLLNGFEPEGC